MSNLPNFNARKIREAQTPLMGNKPLRDTIAYVKSKGDNIPRTAFGYAFLKAVFLIEAAK